MSFYFAINMLESVSRLLESGFPCFKLSEGWSPSLTRQLSHSDYIYRIKRYRWNPYSAGNMRQSWKQLEDLERKGPNE
jgi:hypothetical protein